MKTGGGRKEHGIPFNPNAQTACAIILCSECLRPRVIYAQYKLSCAEEVALYRTIEGLLYTCGSTFTGVQVETQSRMELPAVKDQFGKVYVRENITKLVTILSKFHTIQVKGFSQSALTVHVHVTQTLKDSILCVIIVVCKENCLFWRERYILSRRNVFYFCSVCVLSSLSLVLISFLLYLYYTSESSVYWLQNKSNQMCGRDRMY